MYFPQYVQAHGRKCLKCFLAEAHMSSNSLCIHVMLRITDTGHWRQSKERSSSDTAGSAMSPISRIVQWHRENRCPGPADPELRREHSYHHGPAKPGPRPHPDAYCKRPKTSWIHQTEVFCKQQSRNTELIHTNKIQQQGNVQSVFNTTVSGASMSVTIVQANTILLDS